jgi:actin-like ATPase involved in cell morphogenesis
MPEPESNAIAAGPMLKYSSGSVYVKVGGGAFELALTHGVDAESDAQTNGTC